LDKHSAPNARRRRKKTVGRYRRHDDEIQFFRGDAGVFQRAPRRGQRQIRRRLVGIGDPALADPGAGDDPLVACFHHLLEIRIAQNAFGHIFSRA